MKKRNMLLIILIAILCIFFTYFLAFRKDSDKTKDETTSLVKDVENTKDKDTSENSEQFVIFGVDSTTNQLGKGTRSDSILLVNVDHVTKKIKVASIFRDCFVNIKGHGLDKITHAHSFGGPQLALDTVNTNFDLNLDKYITVNFINVIDIVNDLNGIELDITKAELKHINSIIDGLNTEVKHKSAHITTAGKQKINGVQAVAYSRIRSTAGGDYKRSERQRTVLFKLFSKAKTMNPLELVDITNEMLKKISSNYSSGEVTDLLYSLSNYKIEGMKGFPTKLWGGKINGIWYGVPVTLESNVKDLHQYLYSDKSYRVSEKVKSISNEIHNYVDQPTENLN